MASDVEFQEVFDSLTGAENLDATVDRPTATYPTPLREAALPAGRHPSMFAGARRPPLVVPYQRMFADSLGAVAAAATGGGIPPPLSSAMRGDVSRKPRSTPPPLPLARHVHCCSIRIRM